MNETSTSLYARRARQEIFAVSYPNGLLAVDSLNAARLLSDGLNPLMSYLKKASYLRPEGAL